MPSAYPDRDEIQRLDAALEKLEANAAQLTALAASMDDLAAVVLTDAQVRASAIAVTSPLAVDFAAGRVRTAGGKVSISASGTGYFCLTNPTGSGKIVTIQQFSLAVDNAADVQFRFDTVLASPTSLTAFRPNRAIAGSTVATTATSTATPSTAGTTLSPVYRLGQNIPVTQDFTVVLSPGQSVAAAVTVGLSATAFYASATWTEV